jgi:hypothetical protein
MRSKVKQREKIPHWNPMVCLQIEKDRIMAAERERVRLRQVAKRQHAAAWIGFMVAFSAMCAIGIVCIICR